MGAQHRPMHGNPTIRVLTMIAALAIMALVVVSMTRDPGKPTPSRDSAADTAEAMEPAQLTVQLSAPARSLSIRSSDTQTILVAPHQPAGTEDDFRFAIPIEDRAATFLIDVTWESPAPNRFLRLILETDALPTKELTLHAPQDLQDHAVTFSWPPNPELESP